MFVTTALAVALAAPVPKAKAQELYFPTVEGTKWVMQRKVGKEAVETIHTVTNVESADGTYTVTVSRDAGGQVREFRYEVSAKGVFIASKANTKSDEPLRLLKLPAKEGDTWTVERKGPGKGSVTTYTVGREEEVQVPAGKFKAIPVIESTNLGGDIVKGTTWYAAGVGVVKSVNNLDQVLELKEFSPGKAK